MEAWKTGEADRPRAGNARVTYWELRLAGVGCRPSRQAVERNQKPRCCVASIPSPRSAMARRSTITTPVVHSSVRPPGASRRRARPSQCLFYRPVEMLFGVHRQEQRSAAEVTQASNSFPRDQSELRTRFSVLIGDERRRRPIAGAPRNTGVRSTIQFLNSAASVSNPIRRTSVAFATRAVSSLLDRITPGLRIALNQCAESAGPKCAATLRDESSSMRNFFWRRRGSRRHKKPLSSPYC